MIHLLLFYVFLIGLSFLIFRNAFKTFKKTRDFTFPISTLILFYFTLAGAYIFPLDSYMSFKGEVIGLHYFAIFERLFPVVFDFDYFLSCLYYGVFILVFQYTYMFFVSKSAKDLPSIKTKEQLNYEVVINPWLIIVFSFSFIFISAFIFRNEIYYALANQQSIYLITRGNANSLYSIHQLANEFCVLLPFIAYTFTIVKSNAFNIRISDKKAVAPLLLLTCIVSALYISILGNRREILSGIVICSLICLNHYDKIRLRRFIYLFSVVLFFFLANDFFRSPYLPVTLSSLCNLDKSRFDFETKVAPQKQEVKHVVNAEIAKKILQNKEAMGIETQTPDKDVATETDSTGLANQPSVRSGFDLKGNIASLVFSNELFYAHFSLYGIIHYKLPLTYGSSFISLIASIIPRAIYPNRPQNVYEYYAETLNAVPGQNYTIHHAAAYYLNFGFLGLVLGGFALACLFGFAVKLSNTVSKNPGIYVSILQYLASFLICAQLVTFITAGPEAYKSMLLEGVLIPVLLLSLCTRKRAISTI